MTVFRTCREAHRMVAESLDRQLPLFGRIELRFHLFLCENCTKFKKQMLFLRKAALRMDESD